MIWYGRSLGAQRLFEHARLRVDAVEDGDLARRDAARACALASCATTQRRLVALVAAGAVSDDRVAGAARPSRAPWLALAGGLDHAERRCTMLPRRAVVLLELDDRARRESRARNSRMMRTSAPRQR